MPFKSLKDKQMHNKTYHQAHSSEVNMRHGQRELEIKEECLTHYSNGELACVKCAFNDIRALSIDHIEGDGAEHRRLNHCKRGAPFYRWLRRNGYPEGYQTLCMNCQWIKRFENGESGGGKALS